MKENRTYIREKKKKEVISLKYITREHMAHEI